MFLTEFHCHTVYSKDSLTTPRQLLAACKKKGIERVVITDHNTIQGALHARDLDPERVIVGEEIMTVSGELLAFFVQEQVLPGLHPREAIARLREQDAFISVSHPFDRHRSGHWKLPDLQSIAPLVDAIEIFNARCILADFNHQAQEFAQQHNLPGTVGSDAHAPFELGRAGLRLPGFHHRESLLEALQQAQAIVRLSPAWVHFYSRYAVWRKKLGYRQPG
jgi:predicted metal-dependent phosphoesterase TrpH